MGEGRLVELPARWVLPASALERHVEVHGIVTLRDGSVVVAACGLGGCQPPWVEEVLPEEGAEPGEFPRIAAHCAEHLVDHLRTHHGLDRPNISLLETNVYRPAMDWGREL